MAEASLHHPQQAFDHPSLRYEQKREPEDIHLNEPRPRRPSAASSFHSLASSSSASHFHDDSPDTSAEGQNSFLAQRAALAPTSNSEGFLVGFSPTLPPALVRWADLITLLLDRELTSYLLRSRARPGADSPRSCNAAAATARLPSGHLIADMADSIAGEACSRAHFLHLFVALTSFCQHDSKGIPARIRLRLRQPSSSTLPRWQVN